ncbi:MAG: hypothetical protein WC728_13715 [Elusimicrobiota bacterium]
MAWLILLGALAVPAVLFWNWWVKMKTSSTAYEVKLKPAQEGGGAFGDVRSQPGGSLPNPIQAPAATTAPAAPPPSSTPPAVPPAAEQPPAAPVQEPSARPMDPDGMPPTLPRQSQEPSGPHDSRAEPIPTDRERIDYAPKSSRDPILSMLDEQKLTMEREAKAAAQQELAAQLNAVKKKAVKKKEAAKPIDQLITVQGIIALPSGTSAIINDEVRGQGDKVHGATIRKITSRYVIFTYEGRSFSKEVSK